MVGLGSFLQSWSVDFNEDGKVVVFLPVDDYGGLLLERLVFRLSNLDNVVKIFLYEKDLNSGLYHVENELGYRKHDVYFNKVNALIMRLGKVSDNVTIGAFDYSSYDGTDNGTESLIRNLHSLGIGGNDNVIFIEGSKHIINIPILTILEVAYRRLVHENGKYSKFRNFLGIKVGYCDGNVRVECKDMNNVDELEDKGRFELHKWDTTLQDNLNAVNMIFTVINQYVSGLDIKYRYSEYDAINNKMERG